MRLITSVQFDHLQGLFRTQSGLLGRLHKGTVAEIGDLVAVLHGGETPYLLRKEGSNYTFVASCYVHGIMDGEVLAERERGDRVDKAFVLV